MKMLVSARSHGALVVCATLLLAPVLGCQKDKGKTKGEETGNAANTAAVKPGDMPAPPDVAAPPADAKKTEKGVFYKVLKSGSGKVSPLATDTVEVHYTGWKTDGSMFDSSKKRGQPATFPLNRVIAGWTDGLQQMKEGDSFRFWIPEALAYQGREPKGMLVFDVELLSILKAPEAPADVAAPPADATKTKSGLAYKVLTPGTGDKKPRAWDEVTVHYTGWTTDGKQFDSSVTRGQPATFALNGVIPGWTEGLQLMTTGGKNRFWIPVELAYNNKPGKPAGMLVFDVELQSIRERPEPPPVPSDVAKVPGNAKKTKSGLAYRVLTPGSGASPKDEQVVEIHYTGWTPEGQMFDSSISRGSPVKFPLGRAMVEGWKEGIRLMKPGAKYRFWIPEELGLKGRGPSGTLVFDLELVSVTDGPQVPPRQGPPGAPPGAHGGKPGTTARPITIKQPAEQPTPKAGE